jgi:hypothetical protein
VTDLHRVLTEATEHVASPDLAARALAGAQRRRVRRAAVGALAAVVLVGGGVAWTVQDRVPHAGVVDIPGPTPTPTTPAEVGGDPATQEVWDPFTVVDAPRAPSALASTLEPPEAPPSIVERPIPDIVVAWPEQDVDLRVLSTSGEWRSVPGTARAIDGSLSDVVVPAVSPDGEQVAMSTDAGILVVTAETGRLETIPWPAALAGPVDTRPRLLWRPDGDGFVVLHWDRPWLVDLEGDGGPAPFGGTNASQVMVDPDTGAIRESRWQDSTLVTWDGDEVVRRVPRRGYGERFVTRYGLAAYTGSPGQADLGVLTSGPVVLDATTGDVVAYAPIRDASSVYSDNGNLTVMGFLDETTALLLVTPMDYRTMQAQDARTHLVAWRFDTGDFALVTSGGAAMRGIAVAPDLVR